MEEPVFTLLPLPDDDYFIHDCDTLLQKQLRNFSDNLFQSAIINHTR